MEFVCYNAGKSDDSISHSLHPSTPESNHKFVYLQRSSTDSQFQQEETILRAGFKQFKRTTNTVTAARLVCVVTCTTRLVRHDAMFVSSSSQI